MSKYLFCKKPVVIDVELAERLGINEAIILQQINYWIESNKKLNRNLENGMYWTYSSIKDWQDQLPFLGEKTIRRTIDNLKNKGLLIVGNFNKAKFDRTLWYTIDYVKLDELLNDKLSDEITQEHLPETENACGQNDQMEKDNLTSPLSQNDQMEEDNLTTPIPETYSEISTDTKHNTNTYTELTVSASGNKSKETPYKQIVEEFNKICISLPKVTVLTDKRKRAISSVYKQQEYAIDNLIKLFLIVEKSDFLTGRLPGKDWRASFDWIMKTDKAVAILEGQYCSGTKNKTVQSNSKFTNIYSHDYNFEELERLENEYIDRKLAGEG